MIIELRWSWTPRDLEAQWQRDGGACGVCGHDVVPTGGVMVSAATDDLWDIGLACEECIAYVGNRSPGRSPTLDEYRRIVAQHPHPMFSSYEEMKAAAPPDEDPTDTFYGRSLLWIVGADS